MVAVNFGCVSVLSLSHNKQIRSANAIAIVAIDIVGRKEM